MGERAQLARWRDALRDSQLDTTAKAVGFVIATYFDRNGCRAFPSKRTIADGASLKSTRAADNAVARLELAGFLSVSRSRGGSSNPNWYTATLPTPHGDAGLTPHHGAGLNGANPASDDTQPRTTNGSTPHPGAGESAESAESVSTRANARQRKSRSRSRATDIPAHLLAYDN